MAIDNVTTTTNVINFNYHEDEVGLEPDKEGVGLLADAMERWLAMSNDKPTTNTLDHKPARESVA
jgi:hypothetical protein